MNLLLFLTAKFILGVESGASFPWSSKWQNKVSFFSELPEIFAALILASYSLLGWSQLFDMTLVTCGIVLTLSALISYAGIQSATWMFLRWYTHDDPNTKRGSTTKPVVDWIAKRFGWSLGDEGYAWVAASVKGTIITLPMGGLGGILFAFGYEIGSWFKRKSRSKYLPSWLKPHAISEGMSFVGLGVYALLFIEFMKII